MRERKKECGTQKEEIKIEYNRKTEGKKTKEQNE